MVRHRTLTPPFRGFKSFHPSQIPNKPHCYAVYFFTTRILHKLFQKNFIKYSYRAKEIEPAATKRRGLGVETDSASTGSKISIADFPDDVKSYYSDALSDSVISHLQISRKDSSLSSSIKFSLSEPVEEKDNLIAVHNIYTDKLAKSLKLGGFPMPSIAVTKADMGHENYGECSFVFDKSTIDPKAIKEIRFTVVMRGRLHILV